MQRIVRNDSTYYKAENQIKFKFIREIEIEARENSVYHEEKLQFSEINRSINGSAKPRILLHYSKGRYRASRGNQTIELPDAPISTNLITLYFKEPYDGMEVYCDNHQEFSRVHKIAQDKYLVTLPNGGRNIFHYNNGHCVRVIAIQPLFQVQLIAMNNE
ncbi:hypothetical protein E7Z59_05835 [Robertkochia marina]|uniref:Uncharacterized protein n=2 Tax=Robertkochia marina TaxID=1227945 RepID=A0A4S3M3X8_9FLAO|nr:hypothetical protein E7Z59_05835 [Robertkochia marina]